MNIIKNKNYLKIINFIFILLFFTNSNLCYSKSKDEKRLKTFSTVSIIIEEKTENSRKILLQLRKNTGWMDNYWDLASCGHVEENETLKEAAIRESKEELDIDICKNDLQMVSVHHNFIEGKGIYYCFYFKITSFKGNVKIGEPEKCSEIKWFDVNDLPNNIIPIRRTAIKDYLENVNYNELEWKNINKK